MDSKGLKDWSDNLLKINLSTLASAPAEKETIDEFIESITPDDPWECLYDDDEYYEEDDENIVLLEQMFPDDIGHITRV